MDRRKRALGDSINIELYCKENNIDRIDMCALRTVNNLIVLHPDKTIDDFFPQSALSRFGMGIVYRLFSWNPHTKEIAEANRKLNTDEDYLDNICAQLRDYVKPYIRNHKLGLVPEKIY
ncbi:hypothetical protein ACFL1H_00345 [Nanoarchaeota archaeon]